MKPLEWMQRAFPLKVNLLRSRWAVRIPYVLGIVLIVLAWSAGTVGAVMSEWQMTSGVSLVIVTIIMLLFGGVFLSVSIVFHGLIYEEFLPTDTLRLNGRSWLINAYGLAAWFLMIVVLWKTGHGLWGAAERAHRPEDVLDAVWAHSAGAFFAVYLGWWVLGGLCGMLKEVLVMRRRRRN